jgi:hypothetical protein
MDVVQELFNKEDEKIKLVIAAACLHVMEHGSAAEVISRLPNRTSTYYDAVVKKIIAFKVESLPCLPECTVFP